MKPLKTILVIITAAGTGFLIRGMLLPPSPPPPTHSSGIEPQTTYTCSMHPQFKLPEPGQCPICFMDLIPLEPGMTSGGAREISISDHAAKLMELETSVVERRFAEVEIRMIGRVEYDETRVSSISAWFPGRIDRLFVDYTGMTVNKGDHLAELYSPELLNAQKELFHAMNQNPSLLDSVRERFRLWGFSPAQIREMEERGTPSDQLTINAPAGGIVIHRNATEGMYVQTGTKIFTIADLSRVWVQLDAYESDLNWLRYGSRVEFTTETYPGETFEGTVSFIDPMINPATRTAKVRVIVENETTRLKPGMFVRAVVRPKIASAGKVMNPELAGKWISPMHPEIVKDTPGSCDVCGMALVPAESLGYISNKEAEAPLLVPASAVLKTGKRAIVYIEIPGRDHPTYEGKEIVIGARTGDHYIIKSGLNEGDRVVTRGAFKLDAELQIQAKPSMMSFPGERPMAENGPPKEQTLCPVMGNPINKDVFVDHGGYRIYFCCAGCDSAFMEDPEKYLNQMKADGIEPERVENGHAH